MESAIRETEKKYSRRAIIAALVIGSVLIMINFRAEGKGLVLGAIFSCINFVLMGESAFAILGKSRKQSSFFSLFSILLRYLILAIPLILGIKYENFEFVFVVIGIFMVQLTILAGRIFISFRKKKKGNIT